MLLSLDQDKPEKREGSFFECLVSFTYIIDVLSAILFYRVCCVSSKSGKMRIGKEKRRDFLRHKTAYRSFIIPFCYNGDFRPLLCGLM